jgi:hypothetical protein
VPVNVKLDPLTVEFADMPPEFVALAADVVSVLAAPEFAALAALVVLTLAAPDVAVEFDPDTGPNGPPV